MHIARIFYEFIDTLTKILYYIQYIYLQRNVV